MHFFKRLRTTPVPVGAQHKTKKNLIQEFLRLAVSFNAQIQMAGPGSAECVVLLLGENYPHQEES